MSKQQEKDFSNQKITFKTWLQLINVMGKEKKLLLVLIILMIIQAVLEVIMPIMNTYVLNNYINNSNIDIYELVIFSSLYLFLIILMGINIYYFICQAGKIESRFGYHLRQELFKKLQYLSFEYYDQTNSGWIIARCTSDVSRLAEIISWSLTDIVWGLFVMMSLVIVMLTVNVMLAFIVLVVVPIVFMIMLYFQKKILAAHRESRKINSLITNAYNEGIVGAKTIKTMALEDKQTKDFCDLTSTMRQKSLKAIIYSSLFSPIVMLFAAISLALLLNVGGNMVLLGTIEFGTLALFVTYSKQFFDPLRQISEIIAELQMAQANAERVNSLLQQPIKITDSKEIIAEYGDILTTYPKGYPKIKGNIEFKHVYFQYLPNEPILEDFNLSVKKGETVALVGETGSGKSTVVNLVCRFYEAIKGEILIDQQEIKQYSIKTLHANLGYVLQTPFLFTGSIKENIRFGKENATDEEIINACKIVNVHDFITKLENGYETKILEGGSNLSTGEKQLISFARAIIRDPQLLILDEATSSIDTEKEQLIQKAISLIQKERTCFIIAHRLSTIVNADKIVVMKKGKIIEQGKHEELLNLKGYYYELYTNQFSQVK